MMSLNPLELVRSHRRAALMACVAGFIGLVSLGAATSPAANAPGPTSRAGAAAVRIGVYDTRAIGLAYGRSDAVGKEMADLHARHKQAVDAGDKDKAAELEKQGMAHQIRLHLQVFSNAPVTDAMDSVRDQLPALAQRMNVVAIVPAVEFSDASVEKIDVTEELVKLFAPSKETLKLAAECRNNKPMPIEQVAQMPANR